MPKKTKAVSRTFRFDTDDDVLHGDGATMEEAFADVVEQGFELKDGEEVTAHELVTVGRFKVSTTHTLTAAKR